MSYTDSQRIHKLELFAGLPERELRHLSQALTQVTYPQGLVLIREGDPGDRFCLLLEGEVEIIKAMGTPEEHVVSVLETGDFLGEMSLLGDEDTRSASVRARQEVVMLELTRPDFESLINRQPVLASRLLREMVKRLRDSENVTIQALREKNRQLSKAYQELKAAQADLIEKEKMETELALARRIQESSLPAELPQPEGWQIASNWLPARAVSGDFYDVVIGPDGDLRLLIADVSGKGVPAALVLATARSILRTLMAQMPSPEEVFAAANELLFVEIPANMFVTCFYTVIDPLSGRTCFANAGHNQPYLLGRNGPIPLLAKGMPLGALPGSTYDGDETTLYPGEGLLLYSDGLLEAHNPQGEMFGTSRLESLLTGLTPDKGALKLLLEELGEFTDATQEQEDDITFLLLGRVGDS